MVEQWSLDSIVILEPVSPLADKLPDFVFTSHV